MLAGLEAGERQSSVSDEVNEFDTGPRRLSKRARRMGVGSSGGESVAHPTQWGLVNRLDYVVVLLHPLLLLH